MSNHLPPYAPAHQRVLVPGHQRLAVQRRESYPADVSEAGRLRFQVETNKEPEGMPVVAELTVSKALPGLLRSMAKLVAQHRLQSVTHTEGSTLWFGRDGTDQVLDDVRIEVSRSRARLTGYLSQTSIRVETECLPLEQIEAAVAQR